MSLRSLLPPAETVDPHLAHASASRPAPPGRPWVALNMVSSTDGATAVDGVSGGLGSPGDKLVFSAVRSAVDVILVAAGTVRAEAYGPPRTPERQQAARVARGQSPHPRIVVVTASLDLDPSTSMFTEAPEPPLILTVASAPPERRRALEPVAELVDVGEERVDLTAALRHLAARGTTVVLCEGGPRLLGQLAELDLVDELNLTISPAFVGGDSARVAVGGAASPVGLQLEHLWEEDSFLFARYIRAR